MDDDEGYLGVDLSGRHPIVRQATPSTGHNSRQLELDKIVAEAVRGLKVVEEGEARVIEGWLIYGAALNVGRKKFDGDLEFGQWVADQQLDGPNDMERLAAMWAAENTDLMHKIMEDHPRIKTVRGAHAKHKAIVAADSKEDDEEVETSSPETDKELDSVVEELELGTLPQDEAKAKIESAKKSVQSAIDKFNELSEEDKISHFGEPDVIDQWSLDNTLEQDFNPRNAAISVLTSLNRLRVHGGKDSIREHISRALDESSKMKSYEAEALVLLGEVVGEFRDDLEQLYKTNPNLNSMN
tara:strand:- start:630 stop:1523 length:894 start_codon:yes stop_codon:yes gene_type:complete